MNVWNPWQGCKEISEACRNCPAVKSFVIYYGKCANICRTPSFTLPLKKDKFGNYILNAEKGEVEVLTNSDFFIENADSLRDECWKMIEERCDLHFNIATRRVQNIHSMLPQNWQDGYDNVSITALVENQQRANMILPDFVKLPVKHKRISFSPLLGRTDISKYLSGTELVIVKGARYNETPLNYEWVLNLLGQCKSAGVPFWFGSTGENFEKDGKLYRIKKGYCHHQALKANINYMC